MQNWKCFKNKIFMFDNNFTLLSWPNGSGKSSIVEAVIFCLYGKLNIKNSDELRNDKSKPIILTLTFSVDGENIVIRKEIHGTIKKTFFIKNFEEQAVTLSQLNEYVEKYFGSKELIDILWSQTPLAYGEILKSSFISKILKDKISDTENILSKLKADRFANNKLIKLSENTFVLSDEEKIRKNLADELARVKSELKDKSNVPSSDYIKAKNIEEAYRKLTEFDGEDILSMDEIRNIEQMIARRPQLQRTVDNYNEEAINILSKFKNISKSNLKALVRAADGKSCPVCGSPFSFDEKIEEAIACDNTITSMDYEEAKETLAQIDALPSIKRSKEYWSIRNQIDENFDYKGVIASYSESINGMWKKVDELQAQIEQQDSKIKKIHEYLKRKDEGKVFNDSITVVENYLIKAKDYYLSNFLYVASSYLSKIDSKYVNLMFDGDSYIVGIQDKDMYDTRSTSQLSFGEKTVVALSLILACKDLLLRDSILILDESLGSLDKERLDACLDVLRDIKSQVVVIAHNSRGED